MLFAVTTHPGLADAAAEEAQSLGLATEVWGPSWVKVEADDVAALRPLRTIHDILSGPLTAGGDDPLQAAGTLAEQLDLGPLQSATSFRVSCQRVGKHTFNQTEVGRRVGGVVWRRSQLSVNLDHPDVVIRADVHDNDVLLGYQQNETPLSRRNPRIYHQRVTASCNVAFALAWPTRSMKIVDTIWDPFCGTGTLLAEAAAIHPNAMLLASDWQTEAAEGTRANLESVGLQVQVGAADALSADGPEADLIVANPPHGIRLGKQLGFRKFTEAWINNGCRRLRPGGRLAVMAVRKKTVVDVARSAGLELATSRAVDLGGHTLHLMCFER